MATFVLVHGAWHGGWCWREVAPALRAAGHTAWTPTLTGLGERAHLAHPAIDVDLHAQDVAAVLECEDLRQVVLVGHSYGGVVATLVADRVTARCAAVVHVDAPLVADGQTVFDAQAPQQVAAARQAAARYGGTAFPPSSAAALGITDLSQASWVATRLRPQPLATFAQPLTIGAAHERLHQGYIFCAPARPGSRLPEHATAARARGWAYREVAAGHDVMLTEPAALTAALLEMVQGWRLA